MYPNLFLFWITCFSAIWGEEERGWHTEDTRSFCLDIWKMENESSCLARVRWKKAMTVVGLYQLFPLCSAGVSQACDKRFWESIRCLVFFAHVWPRGKLTAACIRQVHFHLSAILHFLQKSLDCWFPDKKLLGSLCLSSGCTDSSREKMLPLKTTRIMFHEFSRGSVIIPSNVALAAEDKVQP